MNGPLAGIRVLDLSAMVSGPLCTMVLADQGADVIKVENPAAGGDYVRHAANRQGGYAAAFLNNNRNKRSLALDLKAPEGLAILGQLAAGADVFIQNFRPGVVERMGIGEADIRALAPDIIYVSISGFGERGPWADRPVYDPLVQSLSGLASIQGGADDARPRLVRTILPDKLTAMTTAQAVTAALLARARGQGGQHVRVSMLDSVISFLWASDMNSQTFVDAPAPQQAAASFIDLIYETTDGWLSVAVQTDREWQALTRALARPQWLADPRFATPALRQEHINERLALVQEVLCTQSTAHWLALLEAEGVPCAPVLTRGEMIDHPQVIASETLVEYPHPAAGRLRQARPAARFSVTPGPAMRGAPALGEHGRAILAELGYDNATIDALAAKAVIRLPDEDPQP